MAIQTCPKCSRELLRFKFTAIGAWVWAIDHYEFSEIEILFQCDKCGLYLEPTDYEYGLVHGVA